MNPKLLKDKRFLIGAVVVVVIVVLFAGLFFLKNLSSNQTQQVNNNILPTEIPVPTIMASDLGLTLEAGLAKKTIIVSVEKAEGVSSIDYELSYTAKGDIPRGAIGKLTIKSGIATKEITLGTCSDVCHYDTDVKNIKVILKITKEDGSVFSSTATLDSI
jgi:hypothetical protein